MAAPCGRHCIHLSRCFVHEDSEIRKAVVLDFVDLFYALGEELLPLLVRLSVSQLRLISIYINRTTPPALTPASPLLSKTHPYEQAVDLYKLLLERKYIGEPVPTPLSREIPNVHKLAFFTIPYLEPRTSLVRKGHTHTHLLSL